MFGFVKQPKIYKDTFLKLHHDLTMSCLCVMLYKVVNCFVFQLETLPLWPFFATGSAGSLLHVFPGSEISWSNLFEKHIYLLSVSYCRYCSEFWWITLIRMNEKKNIWEKKWPKLFYLGPLFILNIASLKKKLYFAI